MTTVDENEFDAHTTYCTVASLPQCGNIIRAEISHATRAFEGERLVYQKNGGGGLDGNTRNKRRLPARGALV